MSDKDREVIKLDFECTSCSKQKQNKIPVDRIIEKLDVFFATNDLGGAKRLLEYWQGEAVSLGDMSGELSVVNELLGLYRKTQDSKKGLSAVERALELIQKNGAEETLSGATILINAATTSGAFGNFKRATELYDMAESIYKACHLSQDDMRFAALYNNYATTLTELCEFDRAEQMYKKAIELTLRQEATLLDCAVSYVNLAHLYDKRYGSDYEKIEECMQNAGELLYDERVKKDSFCAFVYEKCAPSFDYFGYFFLAEELREKSRSLYERS